MSDWCVNPEMCGIGQDCSPCYHNRIEQLKARHLEREQALQARVADLDRALKDAEQFISNGIEYGFIRMPDDDTPDSAHKTLPRIRAALSRTGQQSLAEVRAKELEQAALEESCTDGDGDRLVYCFNMRERAARIRAED